MYIAYFFVLLVCRKWTSEGCSVKEVLADRVICTCNHLSTYALITDFTLDTVSIITQYYAFAMWAKIKWLCPKISSFNLYLSFCLLLLPTGVFIANSGSFNHIRKCICTLLQGAVSGPLAVHMYVAASIAIFCLIFTLIVFICLKDLKSNYIYNQINVQLCFILALIVYISGSNSYNNQVNVHSHHIVYSINRGCSHPSGKKGCRFFFSETLSGFVIYL